jgi:gephyrin
MPAGPATPAAGYRLLPVSEAQAIVLAAVEALGAETLPATAAVGRVLAAPVVAARPLPPFAASIKDGYAVRAGDGAGVFPVAFDALAGAVPPPLPPASVAYISTGAPLPAGADAVVQVEDTRVVDGGEGGGRRVEILVAAPSPGADVRAPGSDVAPGETVLAVGDVVGPAEVGLAATVGVASLSVVRAPLVAVLSTGDEVVDAGAVDVKDGQVGGGRG